MSSVVDLEWRSLTGPYGYDCSRKWPGAGTCELQEMLILPLLSLEVEGLRISAMTWKACLVVCELPCNDC